MRLVHLKKYAKLINPSHQNQFDYARNIIYYVIEEWQCAAGDDVCSMAYKLGPYRVLITKNYRFETNRITTAATTFSSIFERYDYGFR